jgi:hypothetical protein
VKSVAAVASDDLCKFGGWKLTFSDNSTAEIGQG